MQAGLAKRLFSFSIDSFIIGLTSNILIPVNLHLKLEVFLSLTLFFTYFFLEGIVFNGQSLGKKIFSLKVISRDSIPLTIKQCLIRAICYPFLGLLFYPLLDAGWIFGAFILAFLTSFFHLLLLFHPHNLSFIDLLTNTAVVDLKKNQTSFNWNTKFTDGLVPSLLIAAAVSFGPYVLMQKFGLIDAVTQNHEILTQMKNKFEKNFSINLQMNEDKKILLALFVPSSDETIEQDMMLKSQYIDELKSIIEDSSVIALQIVYVKSKKHFYVFNSTELVPSNLEPFPATPERRLKSCERENWQACYEYGQTLSDKENFSEAFTYHAKACEHDVAEACGGASYDLYKMNKPESEQLIYSVKGCDLGGYVGCYNSACSQCSLGDKAKAVENFTKFMRIAVENPNVQKSFFKNGLEDKELDCIKDTHIWSEFQILAKRRLEN